MLQIQIIAVLIKVKRMIIFNANHFYNQANKQLHLTNSTQSNRNIQANFIAKKDQARILINKLYHKIILANKKFKN